MDDVKEVTLPEFPKLRHDWCDYSTVEDVHLLMQAYAKEYGALCYEAGKSAQQPTDMILHCPSCRMQHVDAPEPSIEHDYDAVEFPDWDNPPHRSHLCHGCGHVWRPADVPTNGVATLSTKGSNDSPIAALRAQPSAQDAGIDHTRNK